MRHSRRLQVVTLGLVLTAFVSVLASPASGVTGAPPNPPTNVQATPGDASALVTWSAPSEGQSVRYYRVVTKSPDKAQGAAIPRPKSGITDTQVVIKGLTNGFSYFFVVYAVNDFGKSAPSDPSNTVVPDQDLSVAILSGQDSMTTGTGTPTGTDPVVGGQSGTFQDGTQGTLNEVFQQTTDAAPARAASSTGNVDPVTFCGPAGCVNGEVLVNTLSQDPIGRYLVSMQFDASVAPSNVDRDDVYFDASPDTPGDSIILQKCPSDLSDTSDIVACIVKLGTSSTTGNVRLTVSVRSDVIDPATALRK